MAAMKNLRELLTKNDIETDGFSINATVEMRKEYSKGDFDFYEPEVTAIELSNGSITQVIELSSAFDELARAIHNSGKVPLGRESAPKGTVISTPAVQVVLPLKLTMLRAEADWELQDALHDDTEGNEQRFEDARWKVFALTDTFAEHPCTRQVFDELSQEKERLNDHATFQQFYAAWNGADESTIKNGILSNSARDQVENAVQDLLLKTDEETDRIKKVIHGLFKVHPRHKALFDAAVDEVITSKTQAFGL